MKLLNKIRIHPLLILLLFIGLLTGYVKYLLLIFLIVTVHELGHVVCASILKRDVVSISLLPFGGLTKMNSLVSENIYEDILIASFGIFFQTILGFIIIFI